MERSTTARKHLPAFLGAAALSLAAIGGGVGTAEAAIVVQRTTIYIDTLPKGCVKTTYDYGNVVVWRCGKLYYQPYNGRYVRVYIK